MTMSDELKCPECGKPLKKRKGPSGEFYGCTAFPECKYTCAINSDEKPKATKTQIQGDTEGIATVRHEHPNSYECGPAGNRHTIRYWNLAQLKKQIEELENSNLMSPVREKNGE